MLILIATLVFWISNPKSIFGQIWAGLMHYLKDADSQYLKDARIHTASQGCNISRMQEYIQYLKDADSYFDANFLKFQT